MRVSGVLFGLAFGAIFAGAGLFIAWQTVIPTYLSWQEMQHWQATSARLNSVSATKNSTVATYRYNVNGVEYRGDRVYVAKFKDNIGSYHADLQQRLRRAKTGNQPVTAWYDPDHPADSVIDRDMRWGLFALTTGFCSVFVLIGLVTCYVILKEKPVSITNKPSLTALRREWERKQAADGSRQSFFDFARERAAELETQSRQQRRASHGPAPWFVKKEWRDNRMRSGAKTVLYWIWGGGIVWTAISMPLVFALQDEIIQKNYVALIGLLFPLVGLLLLYKASQMTRAWLYFGPIELELDPYPGSIGGHVGGNLLISKRVDTSAPVKIDLECVHTYVSGTGENRSRQESIKWFEQGTASVETTGRGVRLQFRFDVPEDLPESDIEQTGSYYFWRVRVAGEPDGIELKREYTIPVFQTRSQSRYITRNNSAEAEELRKEEAMQSAVAINQGHFDRTALARAFRYEDSGQEQRFYYPMFRNKLLTLFALIFAGGFDFASISMNRTFGGEGIMTIVMTVFSLPFSLVGLVATIAAIYLPFNNLSVGLANRRITALRRLLFIPIYYRALDAHDIRRIEVKSSGSTGSGAKQVKHFGLIVHGKNGGKFTIAEDIDGEILAEQLKAFIARRLGIEA
ncbi:MAG: DUF3592 domain-containing protein [Gammaproteobacteria bacterium]